MLTLASWNVNSIRARLDRLLAWLETHRPDVVCLQETKVRDEEFPFAAIRDAKYHAVTWGQPTYNGVAVLSREPISASATGFRDGGDDSEARFLDVRLPQLRVLCCYVPNGREVGSPAFATKLKWLRRLLCYVERNAKPTDPLVVCGDMNVAPEPLDVHDPGAWEGQVLFHPDERAALGRILDWGFADAVRMKHPGESLYSWWDYRQLSFPKNRGLRIDHVFVTQPLCDRLTAARIDRDARKGKLPSDHAPVVVEVDV